MSGAVENFGAGYAGAYDATYADKDYTAECDLVEEAFRRFGAGPVDSVLDLGCGTGSHATILAQRGYDVVGVDRSAPMLEIARRKAAERGTSIELLEGDVRTVRVGRRFDAVLLLFAVLGYQRENEDVRATLQTVREHLKPGGLLVCDFWYGPGVVVSPPGTGERTIQTPDGPVKRFVRGDLDARRQISTVRYALSGAVDAPVEETHVMRFFFPRELELFLDVSGLDLVSLTPTGTLDGEPGTDSWTALAVAQARA